MKQKHLVFFTFFSLIVVVSQAQTMPDLSAPLDAATSTFLNFADKIVLLFICAMGLILLGILGFGKDGEAKQKAIMWVFGFLIAGGVFKAIISWKAGHSFFSL
ncbi:MAG: hypothetical protein QM528_02910 [Phycisphaerales bacterium]|nr:hypothetical protein [Phycisphaerales bacterium]